MNKGGGEEERMQVVEGRKRWKDVKWEERYRGKGFLGHGVVV